jgi:hypothetical protein
MIIKNADDRSADIGQLEQLLATSAGPQKKSIEAELRNLRAGIKAERDAAYLIDFHYKDSRNTAVIHDLRLEVDGRVAQIDHLLIHRTMQIFVLETKSFHAGIKITDDGEFLRWNDYKRTFEGMASPIAQNERHVIVLNALLKTLPLPTRLGLRLEPTIIQLVLVSPTARIDRPKRFDSSSVIKADVLETARQRLFEQQNAFGALAKLIGTDTLEELAKLIAAQHRPAKFDFAARFGTPAPAQKPPKTPGAEAPIAASATGGSGSHRCRHCESTALVIAYGKYGYYFKCVACSGNTPIKLACGKPLHRERLRKDGLHFYRECAECQTSQLFYVNPE